MDTSTTKLSPCHYSRFSLKLPEFNVSVFLEKKYGTLESTDGTFMTGSNFNDTHREKLCFTQFGSIVAA